MEESAIRYCQGCCEPVKRAVFPHLTRNLRLTQSPMRAVDQGASERPKLGWRRFDYRYFTNSIRHAVEHGAKVDLAVQTVARCLYIRPDMCLHLNLVERVQRLISPPFPRGEID